MTSSVRTMESPFYDRAFLACWPCKDRLKDDDFCDLVARVTRLLDECGREARR